MIDENKKSRFVGVSSFRGAYPTGVYITLQQLQKVDILSLRITLQGFQS